MKTTANRWRRRPQFLRVPAVLLCLGLTGLLSGNAAAPWETRAWPLPPQPSPVWTEEDFQRMLESLGVFLPPGGEIRFMEDSRKVVVRAPPDVLGAVDSILERPLADAAGINFAIEMVVKDTPGTSAPPPPRLLGGIVRSAKTLSLRIPGAGGLRHIHLVPIGRRDDPRVSLEISYDTVTSSDRKTVSKSPAETTTVLLDQSVEIPHPPSGLKISLRIHRLDPRSLSADPQPTIPSHNP